MVNNWGEIRNVRVCQAPPRWCTPVVPTTLKAKAGGSVVHRSSGQSWATLWHDISKKVLRSQSCEIVICFHCKFLKYIECCEIPRLMVVKSVTLSTLERRLRLWKGFGELTTPVRWAKTSSFLFLTLSNSRRTMNSKDRDWCPALVLLDPSCGWYEACCELGLSFCKHGEVLGALCFCACICSFHVWHTLLFYWTFSAPPFHLKTLLLSPVWNWLGKSW